MNALPLPPGTRLRGFEIVSVLGGGKASLVYKAFDHALGRDVALKEYLPSRWVRRADHRQVVILAGKQEPFGKGLARFRIEARVMTTFSHPVLRGIWQYIKENGTEYIIMPFHAGKTLRQKVHEGWRIQDLAELFGIVFPILEGVSVLHKAGYCYLGVSPDDILIRESNEAPLLMDFGAARPSNGENEDSPIIELTPGFAAKEQYEDGGILGAWSDIYAVSALVYYMVTGIIPEASFSRIANDSLNPLVCHGTHELPARVLEVFDKGLAVAPENRFRDIASFVRALEISMQEVLKQSTSPYIDGIMATHEVLTSFPPRIKSAINASWALRGQLSESQTGGNR